MQDILDIFSSEETQDLYQVVENLPEGKGCRVSGPFDRDEAHEVARNLIGPPQPWGYACPKLHKVGVLVIRQSTQEVISHWLYHAK